MPRDRFDDIREPIWKWTLIINFIRMCTQYREKRPNSHVSKPFLFERLDKEILLIIRSFLFDDDTPFGMHSMRMLKEAQIKYFDPESTTEQIPHPLQSVLTYPGYFGIRQHKTAQHEHVQIVTMPFYRQLVSLEEGRVKNEHTFWVLSRGLQEHFQWTGYHNWPSPPLTTYLLKRRFLMDAKIKSEITHLQGQILVIQSKIDRGFVQENITTNFTIITEGHNHRGEFVQYCHPYCHESKRKTNTPPEP